MSRINVLDSSVYNLIAAGEVVERPSSVVTELVENSIDAGAKSITVEIECGGKKSIIITDNGCGIEKDDFKKAFLAHATSKIKTGADLDSIFTLGFRGEALASIAAVSTVTLTSRTQQSAIGYSLKLTAGQFGEITETGCPVGTTLKVENLFEFVPARAKFLKKDKQEEQEVTNFISRLILANPNVAFRYIADGKLIYQSTGAGKKDALFCVYGADALKLTLDIKSEYDGISIDGVIGKSSFTKPNRTYQTIVLNGRNINNFQIASCVANAYGQMLMKRQFPFFVLYINLPPNRVDVNVHPNKMEVRFENSSAILSQVYEACIYALGHENSIREVGLDTPEAPTHAPLNFNFGGSKIDYAGVDMASLSASRKTLTDDTVNSDPYTGDVAITGNNSTEHNATLIEDVNTPDAQLLHGIDSFKSTDEIKVDDLYDSGDYNNQKPIENKEAERIINAISAVTGDGKVADGFGLGSMLLKSIADGMKAEKEKRGQSAAQEAFDIGKQIRNVGKLFSTYLLIEDGQSLYLIDQHAAHERLLFEKFSAQINNRDIAAQPLLVPYILSLNAQEKTGFEALLPNLISLGFEIEEFGNNTYKVMAVPAIVADMDFKEFFDIFLTDSRRFSQLKSIDLIKEEIMQLSCKSAIKAGFDLTESEIQKLYDDMSRENVPLYCPHGRPIMIKITKQEIEKWFKRIV